MVREQVAAYASREELSRPAAKAAKPKQPMANAAVLPRQETSVPSPPKCSADETGMDRHGTTT
jgi:hypothetical protein